MGLPHVPGWNKKPLAKSPGIGRSCVDVARTQRRSKDGEEVQEGARILRPITHYDQLDMVKQDMIQTVFPTLERPQKWRTSLADIVRCFKATVVLVSAPEFGAHKPHKKDDYTYEAMKVCERL